MARTQHTDIAEGAPLSRLPAAALRAVWREGYTFAQFNQAERPV